MNRERFIARYGPWAVVTGASDGIGLAFAEELAALGMDLVLVARRVDLLLARASHLIERYGVRCVCIAADLSTSEGLAVVDRDTADLNIGLLVASAGFGTSGNILDADLSTERSMLDVNCYAVLHQCVAVGKRLRRRGGGGIILMSSLVGWQGTPQAAHYAATKAYVQALAEALRVELRSYGVDVLASAPGPVYSGFASRAGMHMTMAATPAAVASVSLQALGQMGTVVPGALSKLLTWSLLPLPRSLRSRIMGRVMASMTRHRAAPVTS